MTTRVVTDKDVMKYKAMVDFWIRNSVVKNWSGASMAKSKCDQSLGNSGLTVADVRQYLFCEVVIALQKYNPEMRTKESTFVHKHLSNRIGSAMKRATKLGQGYSIFMSNIQDILHENVEYTGHGDE
jgi:hypothetical protein